MFLLFYYLCHILKVFLYLFHFKIFLLSFSKLKYILFLRFTCFLCQPYFVVFIVHCSFHIFSIPLLFSTYLSESNNSISWADCVSNSGIYSFCWILLSDSIFSCFLSLTWLQCISSFQNPIKLKLKAFLCWEIFICYWEGPWCAWAVSEPHFFIMDSLGL